MPKSRVLYIEDDLGDRADWGVVSQLREALSMEYPQSEFCVHPVDFDEGEATIKAGLGDYLLAVIDVLDGPTPRGWGLIERARTHDVGVMAISQAEERLAEAEERGAHSCYPKAYLPSDRDLKFLRRKLSEAFDGGGRRPGLAHPPEVVPNDPHDLQLASVLGDLGEETLVYLVNRLSPGRPEKIQVRHVRSGLSGALVLHCDCRVREADDFEFLLKASRDGDKATEELQAWMELGPGIKLVFPGLVKNELVAHDGWHALGIDFAYGETLTDWLDDPEPPLHSVESVIIQVATAISRMYAGSAKPQETQRTSTVLVERTLTVGRRARAEAALSEMRPLLEKWVPDHASGLEALRRLWSSCEVGSRAVGDQPLGSVIARTHGDLHGRNMLVGSGPSVRMIDPADIGYAHPLTDWARLVVDVLLTGMTGSVASYEWDSQYEWQAALVSFVDGGSVAGHSSVRPGFGAAADVLAAQVGTLFEELRGAPPPADWERQLALAIELLRASGRIALLPMPVRVAAVRGAIEALKRAESMMPSVESRAQ